MPLPGRALRSGAEIPLVHQTFRHSFNPCNPLCASELVDGVAIEDAIMDRRKVREGRESLGQSESKKVQEMTWKTFAAFSTPQSVQVEAGWKEDS